MKESEGAMRPAGCLVLFIAAVAFTPLGAQLFVIDLLRPLVTSEGGRMVALGLVGGVAGAMLAHAWIWNQAMRSIYLEDMKKADEAYHRRKK